MEILSSILNLFRKGEELTKQGKYGEAMDWY